MQENNFHFDSASHQVCVCVLTSLCCVIFAHSLTASSSLTVSLFQPVDMSATISFLFYFIFFCLWVRTNGDRYCDLNPQTQPQRTSWFTLQCFSSHLTIKTFSKCFCSLTCHTQSRPLIYLPLETNPHHPTASNKPGTNQNNGFFTEDPRSTFTQDNYVNISTLFCLTVHDNAKKAAYGLLWPSWKIKDKMWLFEDDWER